jgi:hypothetical protein
MEWVGDLRKMKTKSPIVSSECVRYSLEGANGLERMKSLELNGLVGREISIVFQNVIHCTVTGKSIKKAYGDGMSYNAWLNAPSAVESVLRPELSRIHEGIALRDFNWEQAHHNQPHCVYVSQTSGFKVGVTRATNRPYRWHDQGAVGAIVIANVPYRQLAGELEVLLKSIMIDKTNYRKMLQCVEPDLEELTEWRERCFDSLGEDYESFFDEYSAPLAFHYPVVSYPEKIKSIRLDKTPSIQGKLVGIKGQYFIFENGTALNIRNHAGYSIRLEA